MLASLDALAARVSPRRASLDFLTVFGVILAASLFGILTRPVGFLAAFWPANAILLGMMVRWPGLNRRPNWIGALLAYLAADLLTGGHLFVTAWLTAANMAEALTGVVLFRFLSDEDRRLRRPLSVLFLLAVCAAAATVAALCGAGAARLVFGRGFIDGLEFWFVTEFVNSLIILPVLLTFPGKSAQPKAVAVNRPTPAEWLRHATPFASLLVSAAAGILIGGPGAIAFCVPALVWCALTYSVFATAIITAGLCAGLLVSSATGVLALPMSSDLFASTSSIRLGVALIAIGPLTVSAVNRAREDLLAQLTHLASYDSLTGTLSRRTFMERGDKAVSRLSTTGASVALLMFDIDHFKQVNDTYGHAVGDRTLTAFARLVGEKLGDGDLFGRLGGEEFAAILPGKALGEALAVAEFIRREVERSEIEVSPTTLLRISVSIGVSATEALPGASTCLNGLLMKSDAALYGAKSSGRNRVRAAA